MTGFEGGFSSSFGTAGIVDSFIGLVYRHGKDISVTPQQGVTVRHGPYPVGPSLHPTSTWKNTESGSVTFVVISKDRHNSKKVVTNVPRGTPQKKASGKLQSQAEADAAAYHDKHSRMAKKWVAIPLKVSWDVMRVRFAYVDGVLAEKQGILESGYGSIARYQQKAKAFGAGSEGLAKLEVEIGRVKREMFAVREEMLGILAFRAMFEGIVVMFNCRVTELSSWGEWKLNSPQNCVVKMGFDIRIHEKNGRTGMSINVKYEEKVFSWTRLKRGKLEIQDGMFKSFTGALGDECRSLMKVSNPTKTWAESVPAPRTEGLEYIYKQSSSWKYLDQVAGGQDPDISADAGERGRANPDDLRDQASLDEFRRQVGVQPPKRQRPGGTETRASAPRVRPKVAATPARSKIAAPPGELDLSDVMEEIGASPSRVTAHTAASRPNPSADKRKRRPSGAKIQHEVPETSGLRPPPSTASGPKPRSGARIRPKGSET